MKHAVLVFTILGACFISSAEAQQKVVTMSDYMPAMKAALSWIDSPTNSLPEMDEDTHEKMVILFASVQASMETLRIISYDHPEITNPPKDWTLGQLVRIVNKYAEKHPEQLHLRFSGFIAVALALEYVR